jgi:hypothetical protein
VDQRFGRVVTGIQGSSSQIPLLCHAQQDAAPSFFEDTLQDNFFAQLNGTDDLY